MSGSPFDGLGKSIKESIARKIKLALTGKFRCEFCGKEAPKRELVVDYLNRWKCSGEECRGRG